MARMDMQTIETVALSPGGASADTFFRLGMMYSTGRMGETDMVSAHKWFNIAAARGHAGAARYRQEIAGEMLEEDVATAQRAAREWLRLN